MANFGLFSLFKAAPVATISDPNPGSYPPLKQVLDPKNHAALLQVQRWEVNEGGGENSAFAAIEAAFQRTPTLDGMGLITTNFISIKSPLEININGTIRSQVMQQVQLFYSTRRQGVTASQFRAQRPPSNVFAAARSQNAIDIHDIMSRMIAGGAVLYEGKSWKFYRVSEADGDNLQRNGRVTTIGNLRDVYRAAMKMGLNVPSGLATLGF